MPDFGSALWKEDLSPPEISAHNVLSFRKIIAYDGAHNKSFDSVMLTVYTPHILYFKREEREVLVCGTEWRSSMLLSR